MKAGPRADRALNAAPARPGARPMRSRRKRFIAAAVVISVILAVFLEVLLSVPAVRHSARMNRIGTSWHEATLAALPADATLSDVEAWATAGLENYVYVESIPQPQVRAVALRELAPGTALVRPLWAQLVFTFDQTLEGYGDRRDPDAKLLDVELRITDWQSGPPSLTYRLTRFVPLLPLTWIPLLVSLILLRWVRGVRWTRSGRCPKCGYDLRGAPSGGGGGCPECGWKRPSQREAGREVV